MEPSKASRIYLFPISFSACVRTLSPLALLPDVVIFYGQRLARPNYSAPIFARIFLYDYSLSIGSTGIQSDNNRYNGQVMFSLAELYEKTRRLPYLQNVTLLSAYFPRGYWYDMHNNKRIVSAGQTTFFPLPLSTTGLFARGGSIIPGEMQRKRSNRT